MISIKIHISTALYTFDIGSLDKKDNTGVNTVLNTGVNTRVNTGDNTGDNT